MTLPFVSRWPVRRRPARPLRALLLGGAGALLWGLPASASSPAAWQAFYLQALRSCTAAALDSGYALKSVERFDGTGAEYEPTAEGLRLPLRLQKAGQPPRRVVCHYRRVLFDPPLQP